MEFHSPHPHEYTPGEQGSDLYRKLLCRCCPAGQSTNAQQLHALQTPAAGELSDALLPHLRRIHLPGCGHAAEAAATAAGAFVPAADLKADLAGTAGTAGATGPAALAGTCQWLQRHQAQHRERHVVLGPRCRMLARKFKEDTVTAALAALAPCDSAALVLNNGMCPGETPRQAGRRRLWQRAAPLLLLGAGSLLLVPLLAALLLGAAAPVAAGSRRGH